MNLKTLAILFLLGILVSCSSNRPDRLREIYEDFSDKPEVCPRK
jgi:hypothetical protein